jgi:hypothetical protein
MLSQLFVVRCLTIALATLAVALAGSQAARGVSVPVLINGVTVENGVAMITGVVDAEVVEVNGVLVSVGEDGAFSAPIDLSADALVLEILESPSAVVTISIPIDVLLATGGEGVLNNLAAAGISITKPVEGFRVVDSQMPLVEGEVLNPSSLRALTVNGVDALGRLGKDGLFSLDLGSSSNSTTRENVTVIATDRRGVSQTTTFSTTRVSSTIATRAGTSVSAAGAQGIVITRIAVDKRFLKSAKFVGLVVTVKDRRGYRIRGASLRLWAMPPKHLANGALRAGFTNRVGKAQFGFRLRTSALAGPGPKFLTIATRAATPKSSATKKVTLRLPVAAVTG